MRQVPLCQLQHCCYLPAAEVEEAAPPEPLSPLDELAALAAALAACFPAALALAAAALFPALAAHQTGIRADCKSTWAGVCSIFAGLA